MKAKRNSKAYLKVMRRYLPLIITGCFALIGGVLLLVSHAATPSVALEVEAGTLRSGATVINDAGASGRAAVKFAPGTVTPPGNATDKFSIVVMPDTQDEVRAWPADFMAGTKWIADNAAAKNIKYVLHEGDLVGMPRSDFMTTAQKGMNQLDGKVPYIITPGNHDLDGWLNGGGAGIRTEASRTVNIMNQYFPPSKFQQWPSYGSSYPANDNSDVYHKFTMGGSDWGIVTLRFEPTAAQMNWAAGIISANPTRRFIILTHEYLSPSGGRTTAGQEIWDTVAKKYKNVSYVFSGHLFPGDARRVDNGLNGNPVHQMLLDYQNADQREPNTYFRILTFDPVAKTLDVKTYSPVFNKYRTDARSQFTISGAPMGPVR